MVLGFATVFFLATLFAPQLIMQIYTTNAGTVDYGVSYLRWILPTYYCMGLSLTCTIILRSVGEVKIRLSAR